MTPFKPILWRQIQRNNFTSIQELAAFLEFSPENYAKLSQTPRFSLNVPRRLAAKMAKNDLSDPLFRQFVPLIDERITSAGCLTDPVSDSTFLKGKKLLHKYQGRALWLTTSACAMHCRYCFRQNFPYESAATEYKEEIGYLQKHTDIKEIILSGGDPLSLSNESLKALLLELNAITHLQRIRFHTRFPIGIPERIDPDFLELLKRLTKQVYFIIHCNHSKELDVDVVTAMKKILSLGIPVLNQSVLLKGVNDDEKTFLELCESLVNASIIPYYLHLLDPVIGASHFSCSKERGLELIQYVREHLSGYGVPQLVQEIAGAPSKTFIY